MDVLDVEEILLSLPQFYAALSTEEFIAIIINVCNRNIANEQIVTNAFNVLSLLVRISDDIVQICLKYDLQVLITKVIDISLRRITTVTPTDPVEGNIVCVIVTLISNLILHNNENSLRVICSNCLSGLILICEKFAANGAFATKILRICGTFSLDDPCIVTLLKAKTVQVVTLIMKFHFDKALILKYSLELFANLFSLDVSNCTNIILA